MSKSILQDKCGGECYLCNMLLGIDSPAASREEHHVMHGTANRRLAEHYGLKVYLCPWHHRNGPQAVHRCRRTDILLKQAAQRAFEKKYSPLKWMEAFGRNYLPDPPESTRAAAGRHQTTEPPGSLRPLAAGEEENPAACKNQQNALFSQLNTSQNTPPGFCFIEQNPGKEGL